MKAKLIFSSVCSMLLIASCSDSNADKIDTAPKLVASTPEQGGICQYDSIGINLIFDTEVITSVSGTELTVEGATVNWLSGIGTKNVCVSVKDLAAAHEYSLRIPEGYFLNAKTFAPCPSITLSFLTSKASLSNPHATRQALNVYNYLESVYGEKILSGAMAQVDWNTKNADIVGETFGRYPAMAFFDYLHLASSPSNWIDYSDITPIAQYWEAGGIVGACWHWNVPVSEGSAERTATASETTFSVINALTPNTWEHDVLIADLDKISSYLLLLQEKEIPLIWRPLHEAAGNIYEYQGGEAWFWWGRDGAEPFKQLWRFMYEYLSSKGINNLIWVWTSQLKDVDFYPGTNYVDIIGRDIYNVADAAAITSDFKAIRDQYDGKMVVLSENGNIATISEMWNAGAHWGWFMPWYGEQPKLEGNLHADYAWWQDAISHPQTVTREMLPNLK